ncbi:DgyrCDS5802 [Dimorphilus gyrociliatus]|uniref:DgyrCDS5802 n=1 Tax=Dimorphilus gyrociliatus TaxID=2664684 RepID=A0A7I8VQU6_9ANNE|nr:DgyrCDS5802 [Dimorphilus gyrociliatus]
MARIQLGYSSIRGMRAKSALTAVIYRKSLRLSNRSKRKTTVGEIVNLISVDCQKIQDVFVNLHWIWNAPFMIISVLIILYKLIGVSAFTGAIIIMILAPFNTFYLAKKVKELQRKQMELKDSRIKFVNQILMGIKVLKLYAWEQYFANKAMDIRKKEIYLLKKAAIYNAFATITWICSPYMVSLACFGTYVYFSNDNTLTPSMTFTCLALINILNMPMIILGNAVSGLIQAMISAKRLRAFLLLEERDPLSISYDVCSADAIRIEDGTFSWDERPSLKNIQLNVKTGSLVAIIGRVGDGKSSLLSAILGEMTTLEGKVTMNSRRLAYVPQQAWIQNLSLKNNILFDKLLNSKSYTKVINACALKSDMDVLPAGDETEIGERGINVSGGQKQRISLARAVYQDCDIYLFDDPLSAVDSHVGKHIFENVIGPTGLLRNKVRTRILVTHSLSILPDVDEVIVMKDGEIIHRGQYDELMKTKESYLEFIKLHSATEDNQEDEQNKKTIYKPKRLISTLSTIETGLSASMESSLFERQSTTENNVSSIAKLIEDEGSEVGAIKLSVIIAYVKAATVFLTILLAVSVVCLISTITGTNIWLAAWSTDPKILNATNPYNQIRYRLAIYGVFGIGQVLSVLGITLTIAFGSMIAASTIHSQLLMNIVKSSMKFFDTTPLGRILNRFSRDIDYLDISIPLYMTFTLSSISQVIATIVMMIASTPIFSAAAIPMVLIYGFVQRCYMGCARQLKRLDAIKKSPVFAFFSETLNGVSSIRAYKVENRFIDKSDFHLDESQSTWFQVFSSFRWIAIHAEAIGAVTTLIATIIAISQKGKVDPGLVGASVSYAIMTCIQLVVLLRNSCELESYIVSVERIKEYIDQPTEAPWKSDQHLSIDWPERGRVLFKDYSTKYRPELDFVLKEMNLDVPEGMKIGIVGRTGAGKSSLALSLFRIIEAVSGSIIIDDIDIKTLGLHDLRKRLTVIPQDPVIFSGSLKFNIDPGNDYTDDEIWTAVEHAHLLNFISTLPEQLDYECGEDGENLSVGQRQLLCLARALLRKTKILLLDEATAGVDLETDELIQRTIRQQFKFCTIITIAHRINTILDYDRVVVMDKGNVLEYANPLKLLSDEDSIFHGMCAAAKISINNITDYQEKRRNNFD